MWSHSPRPFTMRYRALFYLHLVLYKVAATYAGPMLQKTSAFRFSTALSKSSSLSDILSFRCYISGRTCLFAANSVSVGLSGKFDQLDNPLSVSDFNENNFSEDFNLIIVFSIHSWFAMQGTFSYIKLFQVLDTLKVCVQRQSIAKFLSTLYYHCGCFCVQQHTHTQSALSE